MKRTQIWIEDDQAEIINEERAQRTGPPVRTHYVLTRSGHEVELKIQGPQGAEKAPSVTLSRRVLRTLLKFLQEGGNEDG